VRVFISINLLFYVQVMYKSAQINLAYLQTINSE